MTIEEQMLKLLGQMNQNLLDVKSKTDKIDSLERAIEGLEIFERNTLKTVVTKEDCVRCRNECTDNRKEQAVLIRAIILMFLTSGGVAIAGISLLYKMFNRLGV